MLRFDGPDGSGASSALQGGVDRSLLTLRQRYNDAIQSLDSEALKLLREWPARLTSIVEPVNEYQAVSYTHLDVYKRQSSSCAMVSTNTSLMK